MTGHHTHTYSHTHMHTCTLTHVCTHTHTLAHTRKLEGSGCICITDTTIAAATVTKRNSSYKESVLPFSSSLKCSASLLRQRWGMRPRLYPGHPGVLGGFWARPAWGRPASTAVRHPQGAQLHWLMMQHWCGVETGAGLRGLALAHACILWLQLVHFLSKPWHLRDSPGPGDLGSKNLKGKESRN